MVLCLQRSKLANVQKILEGHTVMKQGKINFQKFFISPLAVSIKEEYLQKILAYPKFRKSKAYPATFQCIIEAESVFQKCLTSVAHFNETVDEDRVLNSDKMSQAVYWEMMDSALAGIKLSYEEAIIINEKARVKIIAIAEVLGIKDLILPIMEENTIKSTEL